MDSTVLPANDDDGAAEDGAAPTMMSRLSRLLLSEGWLLRAGRHGFAISAPSPARGTAIDPEGPMLAANAGAALSADSAHDGCWFNADDEDDVVDELSISRADQPCKTPPGEGWSPLIFGRVFSS